MYEGRKNVALLNKNDQFNVDNGIVNFSCFLNNPNNKNPTIVLAA